MREGEALPLPETTHRPGQGDRGKQTVAAKLLRLFRLYADAARRFISNPAVPFTNNVGERALCISEAKQKISGCFRTLAGTTYFCVIRSCLDTLREQRHGILSALQRPFAGKPIQLKA